MFDDVAADSAFAVVNMQPVHAVGKIARPVTIAVVQRNLTALADTFAYSSIDPIATDKKMYMTLCIILPHTYTITCHNL